MKKQIILSLIVLNAFFGTQHIAYGQDKKNEIAIHESIRLETDKIFDKLVEIRRDFHKYPELSGEEKRTQEVIKKHLLDLGLQVETDIYGYGIVGILKGDKEGKNIAWRADIDALPDSFPDNVEFRSVTKGVKHACGHDVHTTIALGIAEVLAKNKNALHGTAYFIFQPAEETFEGAKAMVENGLFTKFNIDEVYGLHVTPAAVGQILVKPNEMYAYQKVVRVELKNTLSEEAAKELATEIRNSLVRTIDGSKPWEIHSVIDPEIGLMNPNTIFKDYLIAGDFGIYTENDKLYMDVQLFETDSAKLKSIIPAIEKVIEDQNYSSQLLSVSFISGNPIVINNPALTSVSINVLDSIYGKGLIVVSYGQMPFSNDDFAYFQQKIPGVYFFLGAGAHAMPHAPDFGIDEECIRTSVSAFSSLIFERLK